MPVESEDEPFVAAARIVEPVAEQVAETAEGFVVADIVQATQAFPYW